MADLITVPTFNFNQGDFGDIDFEIPIQVNYYNGSIQLSQRGVYDEPERINIHPDYVEKLFKEIKKHKAEAEKALLKN